MFTVCCPVVLAQTGVLQRCAGHRGVFHSERSHSGSNRPQLLLQVQHRQRSYNLAKRGQVISTLHRTILPRNNLQKSHVQVFSLVFPYR